MDTEDFQSHVYSSCSIPPPPQAWKGHSRRVVITNEPGGMETKVEKALSEVKRFLKSAKKE